MKALTRVAFYALAISVVPFSYSYAQEPVDLAPDMVDEEMVESQQTLKEEFDLQAMQDEMIKERADRPPTMQEAKEALEALPGAKHAVKGKVPVGKKKTIYDIYGRQLAYREGAKEYRESLDKRRDAFAKPRTKMIEDYRKTRDIIHAAETAEYRKKLNAENEDAMVSEAPRLPTGEAYNAVVEYAPATEEIGLREQRIPTDVSERKKVVTAGNAPEFDPARLNMKPVLVENAVPPPMPKAVQEKKVPALEKVAKKVEVAVPVPAPEEVKPVEEAPEVAAPAEEEAVEAVGEIPAVEEAVPVVNERDEEVDALVGGGALDNPFEAEEMENPFTSKEELLFND